MTRIRKAVLTFAGLNPDPKPTCLVTDPDQGAEYLDYLLSLADRLLNEPAREDELQAAWFVVAALAGLPG